MDLVVGLKDVLDHGVVEPVLLGVDVVGVILTYHLDYVVVDGGERHRAHEDSTPGSQRKPLDGVDADVNADVAHGSEGVDRYTLMWNVGGLADSYLLCNTHC